MDIWLRFWAVMGRVSVRTKIFGIVFSITLLLSMTSIYQVRSNVKDELVQQFREEGISIARDVAARAVDLILINDLYSLHELLLETKDNFPDVRYVFILDADGEIPDQSVEWLSGLARELGEFVGSANRSLQLVAQNQSQS